MAAFSCELSDANNVPKDTCALRLQLKELAQVLDQVNGLSRSGRIRDYSFYYNEKFTSTQKFIPPNGLLTTDLPARAPGENGYLTIVYTQPYAPPACSLGP